MSTAKRRRGRAAPTLRVPVLRIPSSERLMWQEYAALRRSKADRAELNAWARRHRVEVKGDRVHFKRQYVAARTGVAEATKDCIRRGCAKEVSGVLMIPGLNPGASTCTLIKCRYDRRLKSWVCEYNC